MNQPGVFFFVNHMERILFTRIKLRGFEVVQSGSGPSTASWSVSCSGFPRGAAKCSWWNGRSGMHLLRPQARPWTSGRKQFEESWKKKNYQPLKKLKNSRDLIFLFRTCKITTKKKVIKFRWASPPTQTNKINGSDPASTLLMLTSIGCVRLSDLVPVSFIATLHWTFPLNHIPPPSQWIVCSFSLKYSWCRSKWDHIHEFHLLVNVFQ